MVIHLLLKNGEEIKVRLIGVDTPETVKPNTPVQPYGKQASNYTKKYLTHQNVYLEYDKEKLMVWSYFGVRMVKNGDMFNESLVKKV